MFHNTATHHTSPVTSTVTQSPTTASPLTTPLSPPLLSPVPPLAVCGTELVASVPSQRATRHAQSRHAPGGVGSRLPVWLCPPPPPTLPPYVLTLTPPPHHLPPHLCFCRGGNVDVGRM
ncbi:hypothetical protein E2C01_063161 [Portunus trituberculatus]|uniref:Uncharacterized protein n=1 Tax=Portunus trituberculatus TaxID=210409 RepID=A0A5B7HJI7_PORTR|nr:hypothetical protein [Portunus trituberculatus]